MSKREKKLLLSWYVMKTNLSQILIFSCFILHLFGVVLVLIHVVVWMALYMYLEML